METNATNSNVDKNQPTVRVITNNSSSSAKASRESDDAAHISPAVTTEDDGEGVEERPDTSGKLSPTPGSGHADPKKRCVYLSLLAFSITSALVGLSLILLWMFRFRPVTGVGLSDKARLSNLHPILMYTFMVSLNMYAVLIYRTHYNWTKERLKWTHAIISGVNIIMSLLGVAAMFKAHLMGNMPNFYSLHSWIGALVNAFYLTQFISGFVAFLKPGLSLKLRQAMMPYHRLAGAYILTLAALAAITGIAEMAIFQDSKAYSGFTALTFIANFAALSVILMTAASIFLLTNPLYLRPASVKPEQVVGEEAQYYR